MSQFAWGAIDPNSISGTALALELQEGEQAILSMNSGTIRPSYAIGGTLWLNTDVPGIWSWNLFDGVADISIGYFDVATHVYHFDIPAIDVSYDNAPSMLVSDNVQDAITELASIVQGLLP